jgi:hypothetical protein
MKWLSALHSRHCGVEERAMTPALQDRVWTAESAWMRRGEQRTFRPRLESNFCGPPCCSVPVPTELRGFIDIMKLPGEFNFR